MESDIVFADEVHQTRFVVLPPIFPGVRLAVVVRPFHCGADVTNRCIKPYIQHLALSAFDVIWQGYAPRQVARDRTIVQVTQHRLYIAIHIRLPAFDGMFGMRAGVPIF